MPATVRSGRSSSRPLVMYAGRPKAASLSPIRETTGPPAPSAAVGMQIRPRRSPTMATTVQAAGRQPIPLRVLCTGSRHPVGLAGLAARIAEQREGQVVPARERGVPVHGIRTHPDHLRARGGEDLVAVPERARLGCAAAGLV